MFVFIMLPLEISFLIDEFLKFQTIYELKQLQDNCGTQGTVARRYYWNIADGRCTFHHVTQHENHKWSEDFTVQCVQNKTINYFHDLDHDWKKVCQDYSQNRTWFFQGQNLVQHLIQNHALNPDVSTLFFGNVEYAIHLHDALCESGKTWAEIMQSWDHSQ